MTLDDSAGLDPAAGKCETPIAFICPGDPLNVGTWSGTPYHMLRALEEQFAIIHVIREPWPAWLNFLRRAIRKLSGLRIDLYWSQQWSRRAGTAMLRKLREMNCDLVCAVAVSPICAQVSRRVPTIHVSDATQAAMVGYNPRHTALLAPFRRSAARMETDCIRHSIFATFPSDWARSSAIRDHGGDPERMVQIPWGANMVAKSLTAPADRLPDTWRLLFVGIDWDGKGGAIALEAARTLRERRGKVHLDVVGCAPSKSPPKIEGVTFHGFLRKNVEAERVQLESLFCGAHLFVLPTRFDAFPTVNTEAASYALPVIAYRTGGVPGNVEHGVTGLLLDPGASAADFADAIENLLTDWPRYLAMSDAALAFSHERLNWSAWARRLRQEVEVRLAARSRQASDDHALRTPQ